MDNNLPPFYVGQRVVCIRDIEMELHIKKGVEYVIASISWDGFVRLRGMEINPYTGYTAGFDPSRFAPIDEQFKAISLTKVLEAETPLVSAN